MVSMPLGSRCSDFGLAVESGRALRLTLLFPPFPRRLQLPVALGEDGLVTTLELGLRRDVADGAVQPHRIVMLDVPRHHPPRVLQTQGRLGADTVALDGAVEAFDLAVALGVVRRRLDVRHATDPDELLEVLGDELRPVVRDDPRRPPREALPGPLDDLLDVRLGHRLPDLPV